MINNISMYFLKENKIKYAGRPCDLKSLFSYYYWLFFYQTCYTHIFLRIFEFAVVFFLPGILLPPIYTWLTFFPSEFMCHPFRKTLSDYHILNSPPCPAHPLTWHVCHFITRLYFCYNTYYSLNLLSLFVYLLSSSLTIISDT